MKDEIIFGTLDMDNIPERDFNELDTSGDLIDIQEFIEACEQGFFTDDDGIGYLVFGDKESKDGIEPSDLLCNNYDKKATHINWFNK